MLILGVVVVRVVFVGEILVVGIVFLDHWHMWAVDREIQKEGPILISPDERFGVFALQNHSILIRIRLLLMGNAIPLQVKIGVAGGHRGDPIIVKTAATRIELFVPILVGTTVPLAGESGGIAEFLHPLGNSKEGLSRHIRSGWINARQRPYASPGIALIVSKAELVLDAPGHESAPRGSTLRSGCIAGLHQRTAPRERIHVRRVDVGINPVYPQVRVSVIVGKDDDDIGAFGSDGSAWRKGAQQSEHDQTGQQSSRICHDAHFEQILLFVRLFTPMADRILIFTSGMGKVRPGCRGLKDTACTR